MLNFLKVGIYFIRASFGSIVRANQFGIDLIRASCKWLDLSETGTDAKRGKPKENNRGVFIMAPFSNPDNKIARSLYACLLLDKESRHQC